MSAIAQPTNEIPPPLDPSTAPTAEQKNAILSLFRPKGKVEPVKEPVKEVAKDVLKETTKEPVKEAPKEEKPKEVVKEAAKESVKEEPKTDAEKNFAALRTKAEAAEKAHEDAKAQLAKIQAEYEEYKKKPAPDNVLKELEETRKAKEEYQRELRVAALARDPEFNAKYDKPIQTAMQAMVDIAVAGGMEKNDALRMVSAWDKTRFAEALATMDDVGKMEFGAHMQEAIRLYGQKQAELDNAETSWQARQKQQEEAQKGQQEAYRKGLMSDIDAVLKEAGETPLGKEEGALENVRGLLEKAAGLGGERLSNREMFKLMGTSAMLATAFQRQTKVMEEKEAKIADLEKTVAERDAFIKDQNLSIPSVNGSSVEKKLDRKELARQFLNPVVK